MKISRLFLILFVISFSALAQKSEQAIFAGGCFWCMEPPFDKLPGVQSTTSGYIGGTTTNPKYPEVSSGKTGHYEAIKIVYDPKLISYEKLLEVFWNNVDPYDSNGQFCDKGQQYLSAIFFLDQTQYAAALKSKNVLDKKKKTVTPLLKASPFYAAEDYHQDYYLKNPVRYKYYRFQCGRDKRLEELQESK